MATETKLEVSTGNLLIETNGKGDAIGNLLVIPFDNIASLADGVALTSVQTRVYINHTFRLKAVHASCSAFTGTAKFDVYYSTASVLSAPKTFAATDTEYSGAVASKSTKHAAGYLTLRCETAATTGALANVRAYVEIELCS